MGVDQAGPVEATKSRTLGKLKFLVTDMIMCSDCQWLSTALANLKSLALSNLGHCHCQPATGRCKVAQPADVAWFYL